MSSICESLINPIVKELPLISKNSQRWRMVNNSTSVYYIIKYLCYNLEDMRKSEQIRVTEVVVWWCVCNCVCPLYLLVHI